MFKTFFSRFIPGFEAACTRLRLNHGKTKDVFADLTFLIDHYLERGELERAESLSGSLVALAEGDTIWWHDPEKFPPRKSLRFKKAARRSRIVLFLVLLLPIFLASQHQIIFTVLAKNQMRAGDVRSAISMLRSELAVESLLGMSNSSVALSLADALICDYQLREADAIIHSQLENDPRSKRAAYLGLQLSLLTGQAEHLSQNILQLNRYMGRKDLISSLLLANVLNGHGPYTDLATSLQLAGTERGLLDYKIVKKSVPESETDQKLCTAMGYFCKARHEKELAIRWFKQSLTLLRDSKFKADKVRFVDAVKQYVSLIEYSKPIEARRLEWTAMGIAQQNRFPYETFDEKSERDELSVF